MKVGIVKTGFVGKHRGAGLTARFPKWAGPFGFLFFFMVKSIGEASNSELRGLRRDLNEKG